MIVVIVLRGLEFLIPQTCWLVAEVEWVRIGLEKGLGRKLYEALGGVGRW